MSASEQEQACEGQRDSPKSLVLFGVCFSYFEVARIQDQAKGAGCEEELWKKEAAASASYLAHLRQAPANDRGRPNPVLCCKKTRSKGLIWTNPTRSACIAVPYTCEGGKLSNQAENGSSYVCSLAFKGWKVKSSPLVQLLPFPLEPQLLLSFVQFQLCSLNISPSLFFKHARCGRSKSSTPTQSG